MRIKYGSLTLILIQVIALSAIFGTLSPTVSAAPNDANTETSHPDFPELPPIEDVDFDWFDSADDFEPEFVSGEVLVKFRKSISVSLAYGVVTSGIESIDELNERFKVSEITRIFPDVYKLKLLEDADVLHVAREYEVDPYVEYAEPNGIARTFLVPNDANYTQQWAHQMIESEDAWNVTTGDSSVVIAIVDSGVDYNHPDLAANIWLNTDEIPDNSIDDDQNGFVDDVRGWDFVDVPEQVYPGEDGTEPDNDPMDFLGHGTLCAGVVAAVTNNEIGIAGVTWNSKIMAVRSGYATYGGGVLRYDEVAAGIRYAADNGADIISMSFGGSPRSEVVYDAVKHASDNGVLLVGAAGNDYVRIKTYPAAYEEVVAVTATEQHDWPSYFTNFGNWVEVAAPGVDILSTVCPNASLGPYELEYPYDYFSGTSAATPHVAGVAALILSRFPYMTRNHVRVHLRRTAVDLSPEGFDIYYGYGRISAGEAVKQVPAEDDLLVLSWKLPFVSEPGDTVAVNTTVLNFGNNIGGWNTSLLDDGFEGEDWDANWDDNGVTSWRRDDSPVHSGSYSAWATNNREGYITSDDLNASGASAIYIEFWFRKDDTESTDYTLYYFNGSNYNLIDELDDNGADDVWIKYTHTVTDSQYFVSNFRIRLDATLGGGKNVWLDDVLVKIHFSIKVKLLVNGTEEDSKQITVLKSGESATVSCLWTLMDEGTYNVTTYVEPTKNELSNDTENNAQFAYSWGRYGKTVKVPEDFPTIQEAIETTNLGIYCGDATIRVSNGTYNEYGLLMQNMLTSLTLAGENSRTTIISGYPNFVGLHANADNVTIKGFTIQNSYVGVQMWGDNCIASSNNLTNNLVGVNVLGYYNNTVRDNIVSENSRYGILIESSSGNTIINNTMSSNEYGLFLGAANETLVSGNTITNNYKGIFLVVSSHDVLTNNALNGNTYGFGVQGDTLSQFIHDIDITNTVDGKPIYYLINQSNLIIEPSNFPDVGYLGLVNSTGVTVRNLNLSKNNQGVMFAYTKDSKIQNVNSSNNIYGISFYTSNNTFTINNTLTNDFIGVYTWASTNNTMTHNVLSNDNYGIYLQMSGDNNIGSNTIANTYIGISSLFSNSSTLEDNTVTDSTYGIYIHSSNSSTLESNTVTNSTYGYGISIRSSNDNTLEDNTVTDSTYGIFLSSCESSVLTNNNMTENNYNFFIEGFSLAQFIHYINTSNTVNGKPMYYLINQAYLVIDPSTFPDIGYLGLVNSTNITVENVTIPTNNSQGILFAYVTDSAIRNVNASNNYDGIHLLDSNRTSVTGNTLMSNVYGVRMRNSHNNTVDGNVITEIDKEGMYLEISSGNIISGNTVSNCSRTGYYSGINLLSDSGNNTISGNTISYNSWGIRIIASNDNLIYHNNFINNTLSGTYVLASSNSWDNGAEGNYWSDYMGEDVNGDGIGDTPYIIAASNQDNYPLMNLWSELVYALSLHVMDWDLTDSIQGAYVYVDSDIKISDADGWANWTGISGAIYVKVKWHGFWVNGTFLVVVNSDKTIDIQSNIFDITVTAVEGEQSAVLQNVNVTVYNATSNMIRTGITDSDGKVYLANVPNSTLTFIAREDASSQNIIANVTRTITTENQAETIICDQNYVSVSQEWGIIADNNISSLSLAPLPAFGILKYLRINTKGLKERVKKIRSKQGKERERR